MRLKQLKLAGFKSFANPTTFHFKHTITAIVGPNGCGKSNVIDAVRWVLGESSAKQLRGGAMSDVIFAGSQEKSAKSLASVELVFEHTQGDDAGRGGINHALNLYHELSVRRQITKDGKSDYFINGTKVRRRDVVDVFLGTGLGARSYAVIEQGMIGRIIDANAMQLREFIEEASGVSRYQNRREETQRQLDIATDNLSRLKDMTSELTAQQKRLEKQAKTAKQAQEFQQHIDKINQQLLVNEHFSLYQKRQQLEKEYQLINQNLEKKQQIIEHLTHQQKQILTQNYEQQIAQQEQQNQYQRHWQQQHETQTLFNQQNNLLNEQQSKIVELNTQDNELTNQILHIQSELEQNQKNLTDLPNQLEKIQQQLSNYKQQTQDLTLTRQKIANQISQLHKDKQELDKQQAINDNLLKTNQQQLVKIKNQQKQHEQQYQKWQEKQQQIDENDDTEQSLSEIFDKISAIENRVINRQEQIAEQMDEVESLKCQHQQAEQQIEKWQTEQDTLQKLLNHQEQFLKKLKQNQKVDNNFPLLIERLELSEKGKTFSKMFDELLPILTKWTVANFDDLANVSAQSFLNNELLLKNIDSQSQTLDFLRQSDWVLLNDLLLTPNLPMFHKIWCCQSVLNVTDVVDILPKIADNWLLFSTQQGDFWLFSAYFCVNLYQTSQNNEQIPNITQRFSQQHRIDELQDLIEKQHLPLNRLKQRLQEATVSLQEWQAQDQAERQTIAQLNEQKQKLNTQKLEKQHQQNHLQSEKNRLDEQQKHLNKELSEIEQIIQQFTDKEQEIKQKLAEIQPVLGEAIHERESFDSQLNQAIAEQKRQESVVNELTIALTKGQLQRQHQADNQQKLQQQQRQIKTQIEQLNQSVASLQQQLPTLTEQLASFDEKLTQSEEKLQEITAELAECERQKQQLQQQLDQTQSEYQAEQQAFYALDTQMALIKQSSEQVAVKIIEQKLIIDEFDENQLLADDEVGRLQRQQQHFQQKLSNLGAVNYSAVAELEEVNSRLSPMDEQIVDLTASMDTLRKAIAEIDSQTKQLFMNMLKEVNSELNHLFQQVFGGGQAQLVLADDDSGKGWQAGLELMAQPKGKKNSRLALLSGGEKTLTALSLVFAIFKQQPAPFCVLDEVDAPLDDANVERFTNLIKDLAKDVQFIFISHNKLSMQIADDLKGVTMPTAGISKLVSVDMKDVAKYLENG